MKVKIFNKFYKSFVNDIKNIGSKYASADYELENPYDYFEKKIKDCVSTILHNDPRALIVNSDFMKLKPVKEFKNSDFVFDIKSELDMISFFKYLYILALIFNSKDEDLKEIIITVEKLDDKEEVLKMIETSKNNDLKRIINYIIQMENDAINEAEEKEEEKEEETEEVEVEEKKESTETPSSAPEMPELPFTPVENGVIENLAKEISEEIDVSQLGMNSPDDMSKLFDFSSSNNMLGNIVQKVSSKINEKVTTGELNQQDLFNEALKMMGGMNMGGGGDNKGCDEMANMMPNIANMMNNPMVKSMMSQMGGGGMMGGGKGKAKVAMNQGKIGKMTARDRLRRKLEQKRKIELQKEDQEE